MHEWALADSICAAAQQVAREQNINKIDSITVVLGEVQDIGRQVFCNIFEDVKKNYTGVEAVKLIIEDEPALFECNNCKNKFPLDRTGMTHTTNEAIHFLPETAKLYTACPKCKSNDFKILAGRGVYIKEIGGQK